MRRIIGLGVLALCGLGTLGAEEPLPYRVTVDTPVNAPINGPANEFWFQARAGVVAPFDQRQAVVMTLQLLNVKGQHMYHGLCSMLTIDMGRTWIGPTPQPGLDRRLSHVDDEEVPVDATPLWHRSTGKLILTGGTFMLNEMQQRSVAAGGSSTIYAVYDTALNRWGDYKKLEMPPDPEFAYARAGCTQAVELPDGDLLLPIYYGGHGNAGNHKVTVLRCHFDGETLSYVSHGRPLVLKARRGLGEPSLVRFGDAYYLTLRAESGAYVATSTDGMNFGDLQPWTFDDGLPLETHDTQQHWVQHSDGLFLAYTRKTEDNDNVFRNRAPLFMARVDPATLKLERSTEQVLLPKVGNSEFGNFGVCTVDTNETWVTAGRGGAKPGSPNVYIARIHWGLPNRLAPAAAGSM